MNEAIYRTLHESQISFKNINIYVCNRNYLKECVIEEEVEETEYNINEWVDIVRYGFH